MEREVLSTVTANTKVQMPYPNLEVQAINEAVTLVLSGMDKGDLPVIGTYEGRTYKVASIDKSAINIWKLVRVVPVTLHRSVTDSTVLRTSTDIVEADIR